MCARSFERLLERLAREFKLVTLRELTHRLDEAAYDTQPLATITVDDGYADFHDIALPILAGRGLPATVYVTAGFVAGTCWLWWDALRYLLERHPRGTLKLRLADTDFRERLATPADRERVRSMIAKYLVTRNEDRALALRQLESAAGTQLPFRPPPEYAAMSWEQLRACQAAGIEIGGHTMTHAFLPALDEARLRHEVLDAKLMLEHELGQPLHTFAYPSGMPYDWSPQVEEAVRSAGFTAAVLAHPRPFNLQARFRIGRWSVGPDDPQLDHIVSGASDIKLQVWRMLR